MSGDCPHRVQLEKTLLEYQKQKSILTTTQTDYLEILDELKTELERLSCQVTEATTLSEDNTTISTTTATDPLGIANTTKDTGLLTTLGELEHQNDLLQAALIRATKNHDWYLLELEEKAALLRSRVETMRNALTEKDKLIRQQNEAISRLTTTKSSIEVDSLNNLNTQLQGACGRIENLAVQLDSSRNAEQLQVSESRKLNDELIETKRKNGQLVTQVERLHGLLKDSSENYETSQRKYDALQKSFAQQSKQIHTLEKRIAELQNHLTHDSMETKLLQSQLSNVREKEAQANGELKALQERYRKVEIELKESKEMVTKLKNKLHQNEDQYFKSIKRQQETNVELVKNLNTARTQMEQLQKEHEDLMGFSEQQSATIKSFGKWKNEQRSADTITRQSIEKYESYIRLLTEQNNQCLQRCASLHENNQILTVEIQRLRASPLSTKPGVFTPMKATSDNPLVNRLDRLRQTAQRVLQQKHQFQNVTPEASFPRLSDMLHLPPGLNLQFLQQESISTPNQSKLSNDDVTSPSSIEMKTSDPSINNVQRPS